MNKHLGIEIDGPNGRTILVYEKIPELCLRYDNTIEIMKQAYLTYQKQDRHPKFCYCEYKVEEKMLRIVLVEYIDEKKFLAQK